MSNTAFKQHYSYLIELSFLTAGIANK